MNLQLPTGERSYFCRVMLPRDKPEAMIFAERAMKLGVSKEKIVIEDASSNTGENILFTKKLLEEKGIHVSKIILVHKPYMERRAFATAKKLWPEVEIMVTSPQIAFAPDEETINIMIGDLQRIKEYSILGYQIEQQIPDDVWDAYETLVADGYTNHLLKTEASGN